MAAVLCLGVSSAAEGAVQCPPSSANSTVPSTILVVGSAAGIPDAATGTFRVVVRGFADKPMQGESVVLDFSQAGDVILCADQMDPDALVDCASKTVRKFTDAQGEVRFTILGGSLGAGGATSLSRAGRVYAAGILLAEPTVAVYDLDGSNGVGGGDLSVWLTDFMSATAFGRSDYDGDGRIGGNDLSAWLTVFMAGRSAQSNASGCP